MHTGPRQLIPIANKLITLYYVEDLRDAGITDIGIILGNVMLEGPGVPRERVEVRREVKVDRP